MGRPRPQPIVRLRHLATQRELYVVNTHPSAGDGAYAAEVGETQHDYSQGVMGIATQTQDYLAQLAAQERSIFEQTIMDAFGLRQSQTLEQAAEPEIAAPGAHTALLTLTHASVPGWPTLAKAMLSGSSTCVS